jgi:ribose transport system permease protein
MGAQDEAVHSSRAVQPRSDWGRILLTQQSLVWIVALICFLTFSIILRGFARLDNIVTLVRTVAVLGTLAVAMSVTVIGRGIDLSVASVMAVCSAWTITLMSLGYAEQSAIAMGLGLAFIIGLVNGVLIAYVEIPAILATLATGIVLFGLSEILLIRSTVVSLPASSVIIRYLGQGAFLGVPMAIVVAAAAVIVVHLLLAFTRWGRLTYALGDNREAARLSGVDVRGLMLAQYIFSSLIAFVAGLSLVGSGPIFSTRIADGGIIFDVVLVVVLGGVSLSGGMGGMAGIVGATALIGVLVNGMTILDLSNQMQSLIKGTVLLAAVVIDSLLHPRDEQTSRQGDI